MHLQKYRSKGAANSCEENFLGKVDMLYKKRYRELIRDIGRYVPGS
jgi:hypothetical protein